MKRMWIGVVAVAVILLPLAMAAQSAPKTKPGSNPADVFGSYEGVPMTEDTRVFVTSDGVQSMETDDGMVDSDMMPPEAGQVIIAQNQPKHAQTGPVHMEKNVVFYRRTGAGPRWWKNSDMVQKIGVSDTQVQQMENIFQENRIKLIDLKAGLEKQEARLEPLMQADNPDEGQIAGQIDRVAAARAELEKANALMLVSVRRVLTLEQWKKLQSLQPQTMGPIKFNMPLPAPGSPAPPLPPLPPE